MTEHVKAYVREGELLGFSPQQTEGLFRTVANACESDEHRWQYLAFCRAHRLNPMKGEAHPQVRNEKKLVNGREVYVPRLVIVTSYHVFVARARAAGWVVDGAAVCENDAWGGWDNVAGVPVQHVTAPQGQRGNVMGAWARARHLASGLVVGQFYEFHELVQTDRGGKPSRGWSNMPALMAFKSVAERVCRLVLPDEFGGLYGAEEMGVDLPSADAAPAATTAAPSAPPPRGQGMAPPAPPRPKEAPKPQEKPITWEGLVAAMLKEQNGDPVQWPKVGTPRWREAVDCARDRMKAVKAQHLAQVPAEWFTARSVELCEVLNLQFDGRTQQYTGELSPYIQFVLTLTEDLIRLAAESEARANESQEVSQ